MTAREETWPAASAAAPELLSQGIALNDRGCHHEALATYGRLLALEPRNVDALNNTGVTLLALQRNREALENFDRALAAEPGNLEALVNRGAAQCQLEDREAALASFDAAIARDPSHARARSNRGNLLIAMGQTAQALADYDALIRLDQRSVDAWNVRGNLLLQLMRYDEALASYDAALGARPDCAEALDNRAVALAKLGRYREALESEDAALRLRPDFARAHMNEALTRLRLGDFEVGLRKYEWRWLDRAPGEPRRAFAQPLWLGRERLEGRSIFIHAEQGMGDVIQFARFVPLVARQGATVVLEMPEHLMPLMVGLGGVSRFIGVGEATPVTDFHCPLLSLPLAFGTTVASIPGDVPYLAADARAAAAWRERLSDSTGCLVGVCWQGNKAYKDDHERSIGLDEFAALFAVPGVRFVSLQKDLSAAERQIAAAQRLQHYGLGLRETAEQIAALDLVISVDTGWAHWAGAIGKPVWILLSLSAHWTWLTGREDSPWYPSARLFRQTRSGDWRSVLRGAKEALARRVEAKS